MTNTNCAARPYREHTELGMSTPFALIQLTLPRAQRASTTPRFLFFSLNSSINTFHNRGGTPRSRPHRLRPRRHCKSLLLAIDASQPADQPVFQVANPSVAALYEDALVYESGTAITSSGALTAYSGAKTGRSPLDKRIVMEPSSQDNIW